MTRPNIKFASLEALAASRLIRTLQGHPSLRVNLGSVILTSYVIFIILFTSWMLSGPPAQEDFTDTGVGCIDDCLEPMIEDEAQTIESQGRTEI